MNNRIDLEKAFSWHADQFEAATNRAETDTAMRSFLSLIHKISGTSHWDLETSPGAMSQVSRVIDAWKRYKDVPIEHQVKEIAKVAACKRWGLEQWNTKLTIKRIEQKGPDSWAAFYDEPDTLTEESMDVERKGNTLEASYTDEILVTFGIEGIEGNETQCL